MMIVIGGDVNGNGWWMWWLVFGGVIGGDSKCWM